MEGWFDEIERKWRNINYQKSLKLESGDSWIDFEME